jgi:hypothetical protein
MENLINEAYSFGLVRDGNIIVDHGFFIQAMIFNSKLEETESILFEYLKEEGYGLEKTFEFPEEYEAIIEKFYKEVIKKRLA